MSLMSQSRAGTRISSDLMSQMARMQTLPTLDRSNTKIYNFIVTMEASRLIANSLSTCLETKQRTHEDHI